MANLNKIMVIGNITRDIEVKYIPSGAAVCQFSVAVNRTWNNKAGEKQEETTFLDVEAWEKQAEVIAQYCKKGSSIYVEGRLKSEQWDDKTTGQNSSLSAENRKPEKSRKPTSQRQRQRDNLSRQTPT